MNLTKISSLLDSGNYSPNDFQDLERNKLTGLYKDVDPCQFKRNWLLNQSYFDELSSWKLPDSISGVILKGGHLIPTYYEHSGQRFMGDIDILVKSDDLSKWHKFLIQQGFADVTKDSWAANSFKKIYLKTSGALEHVIELHTRLFYQEKGSNQWIGQTPSPYPGLFYLGVDDLFVHLCGHLAYQHTFLSLHWFYDIFLLCKKSAISPSKVENRAREAQVWRSCQIIALLLNEKMGLSLPKELLPGKVIIFLTRWLINDDFLINPKKSALRYFLVKHLTKDHFYQALAYDLGWLRQRRSL